MRPQAGGQQGSVALETALVAPVVALLVTGVVGLTAVATDQLVAERTARTVARTVALTGATGGSTAGLPHGATVTVTRAHRVVTVDVLLRGTVVGLPYAVSARSSAPLEPVVP